MAKSKADQDPKTQQKTIVHQQLALLEDTAGQSLQTRFEDWCRKAVDSLIATNEHGEPVYQAGKAKSKLKISISLIRTADDALNFEFDHKIDESYPRVPGRCKSTSLVKNLGLAQRVTIKNMPLFDPADGQPTAMEIADAERKLAAEQADEDGVSKID